MICDACKIDLGDALCRVCPQCFEPVMLHSTPNMWPPHVRHEQPKPPRATEDGEC